MSELSEKVEHLERDYQNAKSYWKQKAEDWETERGTFKAQIEKLKKEPSWEEHVRTCDSIMKEKVAQLERDTQFWKDRAKVHQHKAEQEKVKADTWSNSFYNKELAKANEKVKELEEKLAWWSDISITGTALRERAKELETVKQQLVDMTAQRDKLATSYKNCPSCQELSSLRSELTTNQTEMQVLKKKFSSVCAGYDELRAKLQDALDNS